MDVAVDKGLGVVAPVGLGSPVGAFPTGVGCVLSVASAPGRVAEPETGLPRVVAGLEVDVWPFPGELLNNPLNRVRSIVPNARASSPAARSALLFRCGEGRAAVVKEKGGGWLAWSCSGKVVSSPKGCSPA